MDEFPDADEEYEILHEDEMDIVREMERGDASLDSREGGDATGLSAGGESDGEFVPIADSPPTETSACGKRQLSLESLDEECSGHASKRRREDATADERLLTGVTSLRFPSWPFLTFNTCDGDRFYVRFREGDAEDPCPSPPRKAIKGRLLGCSFRQLKALAEETLRAAEERKNSPSVEELPSDETSDLWVEKYKPKKYPELLSDEGVNRSLLNWLKKWDKVVFNRTSKKELNSEVKSDKSKPHSFADENNGLDPDGRPTLKIALLCGPPGLGKTTLAHVVATLAGYNVVEVNASDDRSIEAFQSKLTAATQMQCVKDSKKPNCLILDEIDGAPASSVDYLLKYVNGKITEKGSGGKGAKVKVVVKRPVICICNEPYVPSLRQLRQQAYVVHFPHTSSSRLAQRLLEICRKQGIKTDLSTLTILCDKMQSDIRCCISTLHFFKSRNGQTFKATDVSKCNVGQKDMQKGLFTMWQEVFQVPMRKNSIFAGSSAAGKGVEARSTHLDYSPKNMERLNYLVQLFQSSGDFERLQQGVYENCLKMKFPRATQTVLSGAEWFCWSDTLDTFVKETQNYVLVPYLPYSFAAWHFLFASTGFSKLTFPKDGYENHLRQVRTKQVLSDVLRGLAPAIRSHSHGLDMVLDVLPMFRTILVPSLRPVNPKLFNEREKKDFAHLVDVMLDYNMNYVQERAPDGTYHYEFDPRIEEITEFAATEKSSKPSFSYNMKQIISREIEMERVRRYEALYPPSQDKDKQVDEEAMDAVSVPEPKLPNHLLKLKPKEVKIGDGEVAQYKDFFGRVVTAKPSNSSKVPQNLEGFRTSRVWFTYKEGFNNAVKKNVTIGYLL